VKRLAVFTPGFAADCLETLEEIGVENAEYFHAAGGEKFAAPGLPQRQRRGDRRAGGDRAAGTGGVV
jgi:protoheme ferro-lyase